MSSANQRVAASEGQLQGPSSRPWTMDTVDTSNLDAAEATRKLQIKKKLIGSSPCDEHHDVEKNLHKTLHNINSSSNESIFLESDESSSSRDSSLSLELIQPDWYFSQPKTPNMSALSFGSIGSEFDDGPSIESIPSSPEAEKE